VNKKDNGLAVTYRPIRDLKENPNNARCHSRQQLRQIARSIQEFGFTNPILLDANDMVIAGHGRLAAAKLIGLTEVPTIKIEGLSREQKRAYVLVDNKLAERAEWNKEILAIELQHLSTTECEFDVTITGFEMAEIDLLITGQEPVSEGIDQFEVEEHSPVATTAGDVWRLGKHRVICGNSLEQETYETLLGKQKASVVFSDSPFNVPIRGHVSGNGSIQHREFAMAVGEMSSSEFTRFLAITFRHLARHSSNGSVHYCCCDWRHLLEIQTAGDAAYEKLLNVCVWVKDSGGMGSFYRSRHELIFVFRNGQRQHRNNVQLGCFGRNRTNVWEYPGINTLSRQSSEGNLLALHPTVKPVALVADVLLDSSARGDIVMDPFLGSGSTLVAAEQTGRACYGIELDPIYVDTAVKRWQRPTGDFAIHVKTGRKFDDIANEVAGGENV
jgi:hypothetical protein